jgi:hypothetical protein
MACITYSTTISLDGIILKELYKTIVKDESSTIFKYKNRIFLELENSNHLNLSLLLDGVYEIWELEEIEKVLLSRKYKYIWMMNERW